MCADEAMLLDCFDSWPEGMPNGKVGIALQVLHTAFGDSVYAKGYSGEAKY